MHGEGADDVMTQQKSTRSRNLRDADNLASCGLPGRAAQVLEVRALGVLEALIHRLAGRRVDESAARAGDAPLLHRHPGRVAFRGE